MPALRTLFRSAVAATAVMTVAATVAVSPAGAASSSDKKIAKAGIVTATDVPSSWDASPADSSDEKALEKAAKKISDCKTYLSARKTLDQAANAKSQSFSTGDESLSNETWVFSSASAAKKAFSQMADDTNADCLTQLFQDQFDALVARDSSVQDMQVGIGQATASEMGVLGGYGDEVVGYAGAAQITGSDGTVQLVPLANVVVRQGRAVLSYTVSGAPSATGDISDEFALTLASAIDDTVTRIDKAQS